MKTGPTRAARFEQWFDQSWTTGLAQNTFDRRMGKDSYATRWDTKLPLTDYPLLDPGTPSGPGGLLPRLAGASQL